jgi:hypothetical protein
MDILTKRIYNLPKEMSREIFSYIIPDPNEIEFCKEDPNGKGSHSYNCKYEVAYYQNKKIWNFMYNSINIDYFSDNCNYYLSRISKKNGKHRYYITREEVDVLQVEHNDREVDIYHFDYISKYIGKNLEKALIEVIYPSIKMVA